MSEKIKIGIIGTGNISWTHMNSYVNNPHVELYAICDINEVNLNKTKEKYQIDRVFSDYNEMLKLPELDAVSVCTWNSEHAPATIAALNAKKHVLCEKPMSINTETALKMKEAAEKNGKLLMIGFVRRHCKECVVAKDFIDNGALGEIYYMKANCVRRYGNPGGWFGDKSRSGGGPLIDLGVHIIDLACYLSGGMKPVSVYGATFTKLGDREGIKDKKAYVARSSNKDDICDVEDLATAMVRFENGALLHIETSFCLNVEQETLNVQLFGTEAGINLMPEVKIFNQTNGYLTNLSFASSTQTAFQEFFNSQIDHFVDCIMNGTPCIAPAEDGVNIMRILDAVYESARTGHEVIL